MNQPASANKTSTILVIKGQGIGPSASKSTKAVLAATGLSLRIFEGSLGYPDAQDLFSMLQHHAPEAYRCAVRDRSPVEVGQELELRQRTRRLRRAILTTSTKKLLGKLQPKTLKAVQELVTRLERTNALDAGRAEPS